jgi:probable aminopeptidase NPEPL1
VVRIGFAKDLKAASSLLVIAPKATFAEKKFPDFGLAESARRILIELGKETTPGDNGSTSSSLTEGKPERVIAGVLPDEVSRYNTSSRAEAICRVVSSSGIASKDKPAIALVLDSPSHVLAALNAIGRALPLFSQKSSDDKATRITVAAFDTKGKALPIPELAKNVMELARDAAFLVDTPPTDLNPAALARAAQTRLSRIAGVKVNQIVGKELVAKGLLGIHSVGRCAVEAPRMLIAHYKPKKKSELHVALVGKGITFDTGGLHIKPRGSMETMKTDMGGAAAVLGAFRALAEAGVEHALSLVLCLAENAIGPNAYKPDDILTMHSQKTVEINNTDAEGRLLLADGVSWAARELGATHVFDAATLTGAQLVSTGLMHAAVFSNDADLEELFVRAGKETGDLCHPLPFAPEFYRSEFKSPIADMRNSVKNRSNAQSSCAAQFIYNHLEDTDVKWVHVDLAGPSFRNERGTGFGVALLTEAVRNLG